MGKFVELVAGDGHSLSAYKAEPSETPSGGVVVIQEIFGVNEHIREVTDLFAKEGFLAIAPALFDRVERGVELGYGPDDRDTGIATRAGVKWDDAVNDIVAARESVAEAGKIGVVGYCYGGTVAWLGACKGGFDAASGYYGGAIHENLNLESTCPVELHFGSEDQGIPLENVDLIRSAKPDVDIYVYEGAGHGFMCDHRPSFDSESSKIAGSRTLDFFRKNLG